MKRILFVLMILAFVNAIGQSYHPKGHVDGPMTTTQINAIPNPAEGLQMYNSTTSTIWAYDGTQWNDTESGTGDLLSTNNLSDVADAPTARTNLGLEIGTDVQAYSANMDTDVTDDFDGAYSSLTGAPTIPVVQSTITDASTNAVESNAIYDALALKADLTDVDGGLVYDGYNIYSRTATISSNIGSPNAYNNVLIGHGIGSSSFEGDSNIINGIFSAQNLTTGDGNVGQGFYVFNALTTGFYNTVLGSSSGAGITTGDNNIILGVNGGLTLVDGSRNIYIGRNTRASAADVINEIVLGSSISDGASHLYGNGDNTVTIGNSNITDTYLAGTIHGDGSGLTGLGAATIADGSITEVKLDISNSATSGYSLTSDGSDGFTWTNVSGGSSTETNYLEPTGTSDLTLTNTNFYNAGKVYNLYTTSRDIIFPAAITNQTRSLFKANAAGILVNLKPDTGQEFEGTGLDSAGDKVFITANDYIELEPHDYAIIGRKEAGVFFADTNGEVKSLYSAETLAYMAENTDLSNTEKQALDDFIEEIRGYGLLAKSLAGWPLLGDTGAELGIDLINPGGPFDMTWIGSPTFGTNQVSGNGTDAIGDTNVVPDTDLVNGDLTIMVWLATEADSQYSDWGAFDTNPSNRRLQGEFWITDYNFDAYSTGNSRTTVTAPANRIGSWFNTIRSNTDREVHYNGLSVATQTNTGVLDSGLLTGSIGFMGTITNDVTYGSFSEETYYMLWMFNEGLSDTEISNFHDAVTNLNTALSR